uniref:cytochrome P450 n=1 Tax=uncultured Sphingomonas sp. TaxID=158754 RepID=UPI0035CAEC16
MAPILAISEFATPAGKPAGIGRLLTWRLLPYWMARLGAILGQLSGRPLRLGDTVIALRHADVAEALARDLDFCLQPVNAPKFDQIGYHFILGMDRSAELIRERRVLYQALSQVDAAKLQADAAADIATVLARAGGGPIDIVEEYARPIAANTARRLFGIAPDNKAAFVDAARAIFGNSFLNVSGDLAMTERALAAANQLSDWFEAEIARRHASDAFGTDMMGALLGAGVDDDLVRRTLGGMLVGAIDTTATCVAKVLTVLLGDPALARQASADRHDLTLMWGWCNEALRRWAHGPVLLRRAANDTELAGTPVKAGDAVLLWTQAAMFDERAFPRAGALLPNRVGAAYFHLGGGLHPCAGRGVNAWQIPLLVAGLLDRAPHRLGPMRWAGPFPAHLPLYFRR